MFLIIFLHLKEPESFNYQIPIPEMMRDAADGKETAQVIDFIYLSFVLIFLFILF